MFHFVEFNGCFIFVLQIEVETCDRGGTFLGHLFVPQSKQNISIELLRRGLATLQEGAIERSQHYNALKEAQQTAQQHRIALWRNYTEPDPAELEKAQPVEEEPTNEVMNVTVTEVVNGNSFYIRPVTAPNLEPKILSAMGDDESFVPRPSSVVAAKFSVDGAWYRARVTKVRPTAKEVDVVYIDYGNSETVQFTNIRPLDSTLASLPAQAYEACLAHIKV
jgi:staphylococcal nuclease domain-containing protein 1